MQSSTSAAASRRRASTSTLEVVEYRGTEYYPIPLDVSVGVSRCSSFATSIGGKNNRSAVVVAGAASSGSTRAADGEVGFKLPSHIPPPPELYVPYLHNIRVSGEVLVHQPPQSYASRQPGARPAPKITLQTELGTVNFHEVPKDDGLEDIDPELTLMLPSWELRQPDDDELEESRSFEDDEAKWDDEYWKNVGAYRELLTKHPKEAPWEKNRATTSGNRKAGSSNGPQEDPLSFQRGDSFRIDPKVPPAATGPVSQHQSHSRSGSKATTLSGSKKPPLPAAATRGAKRSNSGNSEHGSDSGRTSHGTVSHHLDARSNTSAKNRSGSTGTVTSVADSIDSHQLNNTSTTHNNTEPTTAPSTPLHFERDDSIPGHQRQPILGIVNATPSSSQPPLPATVPSLLLNDESLLSGRQNPDVNAVISDDELDPHHHSQFDEEGHNATPLSHSHLELDADDGLQGGDSGGPGLRGGAEPPMIRRGRQEPARHPLHRREPTEEELSLLSQESIQTDDVKECNHPSSLASGEEAGKRLMAGAHFRVSASLAYQARWSLVATSFKCVDLQRVANLQASSEVECSEDRVSSEAKTAKTSSSSTTKQEEGSAAPPPPEQRKAGEGGCCVMM